MTAVTVVDHPVLAHRLAQLRDSPPAPNELTVRPFFIRSVRPTWSDQTCCTTTEPELPVSMANVPE